jgi:hypothetical protein
VTTDDTTDRIAHAGKFDNPQNTERTRRGVPHRGGGYTEGIKTVSGYQFVLESPH